MLTEGREKSSFRPCCSASIFSIRENYLHAQMERIKVIEKYLSPDFMERDEDGYKGLRVSLQCGSGHNDCVSGAFTKPLSVDSEEPL